MTFVIHTTKNGAQKRSENIFNDTGKNENTYRNVRILIELFVEGISYAYSYPKQKCLYYTQLTLTLISEVLHVIKTPQATVSAWNRMDI